MRYNNRRENEIDFDRVAEFLKASVQQVKTQEDVDVLIQLKKVFKKNVPFTLRGYLSAYLLKVATGNARRPFVPRNGHENYSKENYRERREEGRREFNAPAEGGETRHEPHPRVEIDPALATTIFIGIGRNRRVFPRDLVGLLIGVAGLDRERIGDIRVLANYSFVQLFTEDADKAITALNGYDYRGRKLSVSYSRQRDDEADASSAAGESASSASGEQGAAGQVSGQELSEQEREDAAAYAAAEKASENQGFGSPLV